MAAPKRQLWKDRTSGKLWAVELSRGRVVGCCGPLEAGDLSDLTLDHLPFERDRGVLRSLSARRDQFERPNGGEEAA